TNASPSSRNPDLEAFREANRFGREPQPGLALLRLAQGDAEAAAAAVRRALGETAEPLKRARILPRSWWPPETTRRPAAPHSSSRRPVTYSRVWAPLPMQRWSLP